MVFAGNPELLVRFRQGDSAALETVYWAYVDHVTRIIQAVVNGYTAASGARLRREELGDLVQEVFVRAFSPASRQGYDGERAYGPYLGQIGRNVVADHWRSLRRQVVVDMSPLLDALSVDADRIENASEQWSDPQTIAVVERYLASLEPEMRRVHDALYVRGLSQRDAAAALGLGRQAIRGIEARLRAGLRRELSRTGLLPEDLARPAPAPATARGGLR
ncbi:MAG TPA: sigma-70 family RNA polymerase sigma factor [Polyangia bacterium]|nr:sigma-70 family RNA polymerase sigma factor [Polyangia bacterium]